MIRTIYRAVTVNALHIAFRLRICVHLNSFGTVFGLASVAPSSPGIQYLEGIFHFQARGEYPLGEFLTPKLMSGVSKPSGITHTISIQVPPHAQMLDSAKFLHTYDHLEFTNTICAVVKECD